MTTNKLQLGEEALEKYRNMKYAKELYYRQPNATTHFMYTEAKKAYDNIGQRIVDSLAKDFYRVVDKRANSVDKPPVEIGDTVYFIMNGEVYKTTVVLLSWTQYSDKSIRSEIRGEVCPFHTFGATWDEWGKVVFGTEEEAKIMLTKKEVSV